MSYAKYLGYSNIRGEDSGSSERLSELIVRDYNDGKFCFSDGYTPDKELLILCGDKSLDILPSQLSKAKIKTRLIRTYATSPSASFCEDLYRHAYKAYYEDHASVVFLALFSPSALEIALPALRNVGSVSSVVDSQSEKKSTVPVIIVSSGSTTTARLLDFGIKPLIQIERGNLFPENFAKQLHSYLVENNAKLPGC